VVEAPAAQAAQIQPGNGGRWASTTLRPAAVADVGLSRSAPEPMWRSPPSDHHPAQWRSCAASPPPSKLSSRGDGEHPLEPLLSAFGPTITAGNSLAAGVLFPFNPAWLLSPMIAGACMAFSSVSVVNEPPVACASSAPLRAGGG